MKAVSDWDNIEIGQFAEVIGGGTPSTKQIDHFGGDIPWLTPRDLVGFTNRYIFRGNTNLTPLGLKNSSARLMLKDTVIFSSRAPIGYVALAGCEIATNQGFRSLVCNQSKAFPEFVYYAMRFHTSRIENIAGGSTFKEISGGMLEKYKIFLPPLPTQKKIASILSTYDDLIENNNKRIKILEEMAQNIYREWFVHFRYPGHEDVPMVDSELGQIPQGWEVKRISELYSIQKGLSYGSEGLIESGGIPMINLKNVNKGGGFRSEGIKNYSGEFKESHRVRGGDVVIAVTDMTPDRNIAGRAARIPNYLGEAIISTDLVRMESVAKIGKAYTYGLFSFSTLPLYLKEFASGTNVQHLSSSAISIQKVIVPPQSLQEEYDQISEPSYALKDDLEEKNQNLRKTRDLLLPRLISGQLDVEELDIEV